MHISRAKSGPLQTLEFKNTTYHDKFVVVYDFSNPDLENALQELTTLLKDLKYAGLHTEVRAGYDQSLLVFVQAPKKLLGNTVYRSRVKDWLYNITKHHPGGSASSIVKGNFEAEDLLSVSHLVHWRKEQGGAGITPQFGMWENVTSVFPLHNDSANQDLLLHLSKKLFLNTEDLDRIRNLWGAKVAFYFAFIQTYFFSLAFPCVTGIIAWIFLPKYSLLFALIIGVWCTVFLEYWKLREIDLSIRWNVRGVSSLKSNRPQFQYEREIVDAAGRVRQYFPRWKRIARQFLVAPFVFMSTLLLGLLIVSVFAIEIFISEAYDGPYKSYLEYVPTVLLAILLPYISSFLEAIACTMTEYENHRTQDHHEMSLTQKIFVLNFITNYLPIFLTAFIYVPFGHVFVPKLQRMLHSRFKKSTLDGNLKFESDPDRLRNEVITLTVTGQIFSAVEELVVPYLKTRFKEWWRDHRTSELTTLHDDPLEAQFLKNARRQAILEHYDVQEDISEMVIQFGYLALFSPVWPLIPIGFFLNNWFELRSDFLKICIEHQRPTPARVDGIGPWVASLEALTWLGSISSSAIVHLFGTHHILRFIGSEGTGKWWSLPITVFVSEHIFLGFRAAVRFVLNEIGSKEIRRERSERYAERKKYLDELEKQSSKDGDSAQDRQRRKSVRIESGDAFWMRQVDDDASEKIGIELIHALKTPGAGKKGARKVD